MSDPQKNNIILSSSSKFKDNLKNNSVVAISAITFITSIGLILAHLAGGIRGTEKPSLFFSIFGFFLLVIKLIENITKKNKPENEKGLAEPNLMKQPSIIFAITCLLGLGPMFMFYVVLYNTKIKNIIRDESSPPEGRVDTSDGDENSKMGLYRTFIMIIYSIVLVCLFLITFILIGGMGLIKKFKYIPLAFSLVAFVLGAIVYRFVTLQIKFYSTTG